ncbi:hypothetical protein [Acrocarpospora sp. B8E8]|uniref:hypothetical protein n=1 Tax=Acrocarpospora sp. B8E8 TaxID=3153572 RepID=UPI00325D5226
MTDVTGDSAQVWQIADLLAWCRRLQAAGPGADPTEVAAYQAAKAEVMERIAIANATNDPDLADRAGAQAAQLRRAADHDHHDDTRKDST